MYVCMYVCIYVCRTSVFRFFRSRVLDTLKYLYLYMYVCMYVVNSGNCCYAGMYEQELKFLQNNGEILLRS